MFSIARESIDDQEKSTAISKDFIKSILWIILGLGALVLGSKLGVSSAVEFSQRMGISQSLVGLTVVAVGTSLPELATSVVAAYKKNTDIAVGNVVGSNIFNIFFVLGTSATIHPLPFEVANNIDIWVTILASLLLFICMFTGGKRKLDRWEGIAFLMIYIIYIGILFNRG